MHRLTPKRSGAVALLSLVFLVLFVSLATAMASLTTYSVQLAKNQRSVHRGQLAAESGMEYLKCVLSNPDQAIPASVTDANVLSALQTNLVAFYQGTSVSPVMVTPTLYLPRQADPAIIIGESSFRVEIHTVTDPTSHLLELVAKVSSPRSDGVSSQMR